MAHSSSTVGSKHVKLLDGAYGTKDPLTITRGKLHEHLSITIDFNLKLGLSFSQCDFIKKLIKDLPDELKRSSRTTLAPSDLFKIDEEDAKLS